MTMIDVDQFNEAATAFYEFAYERGRHIGNEETSSLHAKQHARALLDLVAIVLDYALSADDVEVRDSFLGIARLTLGRTPMVVPAVTVALDAIGRRGYDTKQPSDKRVREAQEIIRRDIEALPR